MERKQLEQRQFQRVEGWLYDIRHKYTRLKNLCAKLEAMDHKADAGPPDVKVSRLKDICVQEGFTEGTAAERWGEWAHWYARTRPVLVEEIARLEMTISFYEQVLDTFDRADMNKVYHRLIRLKYWEGKKHSQICAETYISRRTFFRMRNRIVETFFECLPGEFLPGEP